MRSWLKKCFCQNKTYFSQTQRRVTTVFNGPWCTGGYPNGLTVCSVCKHCDSVRHVKKVNGEVLLTEQRTEERALNNSLWSSCTAAPGITRGDAGRAAGSAGFWGPESKGTTGLQACQSCLNWAPSEHGQEASVRHQSSGGKASPLGSQAEAAAEQGAEKSQFWHRLPEMAVKARNPSHPIIVLGSGSC